MIHFLLLVSRQGKTRFEKFYDDSCIGERLSFIKELTNAVIGRPLTAANIIYVKGLHVIYRRYASLYFIIGLDPEDNELLGLELIHHIVEMLDRYFGNVCELDLIFNFHKVHLIVDEVIMNGCLQETSKKAVLRLVGAQDVIIEDTLAQSGGLDFIKKNVHSL